LAPGSSWTWATPRSPSSRLASAPRRVMIFFVVRSGHLLNGTTLGLATTSVRPQRRNAMSTDNLLDEPLCA
jgi:hypothetical protein